MPEKREYKIVRYFQRDGVPSVTVCENATLSEVREHCADPETNSRTATGDSAVILTSLCGAWFDGFEYNT